MYLSKTSYKVIRCSDTTKTAITASAIFVFACFLRFSTKYGFIIKSVHVTQPKPSGWHGLNSLWFHGCCAHKTTNRNDLITFIFDLDWWERMIQTVVNEYSIKIWRIQTFNFITLSISKCHFLEINNYDVSLYNETKLILKYSKFPPLKLLQKNLDDGFFL